MESIRMGKENIPPGFADALDFRLMDALFYYK